ncbi:MAG: metal ABC transporter substrate-binding protein, partial [Oscillospiraceae bacterium]|nr:metal ABC transporter substrate-binding protein [Oscillospiraceae bacterium]
FDGYVLPNTSLDEGSLDANYFQHTPYLDSFNASNGTDIVSAASIHYEPFGLYGNGVASVDAAAEGATIIIPADDSNETRALLLLQQEGLITLPEGANASDGVTTLDIVDDKGFEIIAVQADTVAAQYANSDEGSLAVINGNYALAAGLDISTALAVEDASGNAAQTYANIVAVRSGDENSEKTTALVNALKTEEVKTYIEETYNGAVVAIF